MIEQQFRGQQLPRPGLPVESCIANGQGLPIVVVSVDATRDHSAAIEGTGQYPLVRQPCSMYRFTDLGRPCACQRQ